MRGDYLGNALSVAYGAGIRGGWVLPVTNTIDVRPTIAMLLGLQWPDADGKPIVGVFIGKGELEVRVALTRA